MLTFTHHARLRCAQRAVTHEAVHATLDWGLVYLLRGGRSVFFLGRRQVQSALHAGVDFREFENTAVVVAEDGVIITAIRTRSTTRFRQYRR